MRDLEEEIRGTLSIELETTDEQNEGKDQNPTSGRLPGRPRKRWHEAGPPNPKRHNLSQENKTAILNQEEEEGEDILFQRDVAFSVDILRNGHISRPI